MGVTTTAAEVHEPEWAELSSAPPADYIQLPVPGVRFSAYKLHISDDPAEMAARVDRAIKVMQYIARKFGEAFPNAAQQDDEDESPNGARSAQGSRSRRAPAAEQLWCPDHGVLLRKSAPKYNESGDRFFHALEQEEWYEDERGGTVKNHSVWRSAALTEKPA